VTNRIVEAENEPEQLERLAAQRFYYSRAKLCRVVQLLFTAGGTVVWLLVLLVRSEWQIWAAVYGISVSLMDEWLFEPLVSHVQRIGAGVQEEFECRVLDLPWNETVVDRPPTLDQIQWAAHKYQKKEADYHSLRNWFPQVVEGLPHSLARIACQRTNRAWDVYLTSRYQIVLRVALVALVIVSFASGLERSLPMKDFTLSILVPLLPALLWLSRELRKQSESLSTSSRLAACADNLWKQALPGGTPDNELRQLSRTFQDEVYRLRCTRPMVPDAFYARFRPYQEKLMAKANEALVSDYQRASSDRPQAETS
jgi:hypothetical protein